MELEVMHIHNEDGYQEIRELLAQEYNLANMEPNIQIHNVDIKGDRSLTVRHIQHNNRPLDSNDTEEVIKHLHHLWGFTTRLETVTEDDKIQLEFECKKETTQ